MNQTSTLYFIYCHLHGLLEQQYIQKLIHDYDKRLYLTNFIAKEAFQDLQQVQQFHLNVELQAAVPLRLQLAHFGCSKSRLHKYTKDVHQRLHKGNIKDVNCSLPKFNETLV